MAVEGMEGAIAAGEAKGEEVTDIEAARAEDTVAADKEAMAETAKKEAKESMVRVTVADKEVAEDTAKEDQVAEIGNQEEKDTEAAREIKFLSKNIKRNYIFIFNDNPRS